MINSMERHMITASRMRLFRSYLVILESMCETITQAESDANVIVAKLQLLPEPRQRMQMKTIIAGVNIRVEEGIIIS